MVWSHNDSWMVTGDHAGYVKYWQSNMNNVKMFQAHKEALRGIRYLQLHSVLITIITTSTIVLLCCCITINGTFLLLLLLLSSKEINDIFRRSNKENRMRNEPIIIILFVFLQINLNVLMQMYFSVMYHVKKDNKLCFKSEKQSRIQISFQMATPSGRIFENAFFFISNDLQF